MCACVSLGGPKYSLQNVLGVSFWLDPPWQSLDRTTVNLWRCLRWLTRCVRNESRTEKKNKKQGHSRQTGVTCHQNSGLYLVCNANCCWYLGDNSGPSVLSAGGFVNGNNNTAVVRNHKKIWTPQQLRNMSKSNQTRTLTTGEEEGGRLACDKCEWHCGTYRWLSRQTGLRPENEEEWQRRGITPSVQVREA